MLGVTTRDSVNKALIQNVMTDEIVSRFESATAEGSGLPSECYTSPEWLKLENERLFTRTWMLAGFCHNIPDKGDAHPVWIAGMPLVVLRDNDGEIQVYHNVCRHRGAVVVDEPCKGKRMLTCPYHSWTYGLDGKLRTRPHFHGGDRHDINPGDDAPGLIPVRHAVWHDLIFVNISGDAVDFEKHFEPFTRRTQIYDYSSVRYANTLRFDIKANWKLVFENYFDSYHVPAVHPRLDSFTSMEDRAGSKFDGAWVFGSVQFPEPEEGRGIGMPYYPGLDEHAKYTESFNHLFPTTCIQMWPDQLIVFELHAIAPDQTLEYIHLYFIGDSATDNEHAQNRQDVYDMWNELNIEDFKIVENMQLARNSPAFDGGKLSPFWDPATQYYARLVLDAVR